MNKPVLFLDPASINLPNGILSNQSDADLKMSMGLEIDFEYFSLEDYNVWRISSLTLSTLVKRDK